nr:odorant receptor 4-like [Onthophagus taurus]
MNHSKPKNYFKFHYDVLKIFGISIEDFQNPFIEIIYKTYAIMVIALFFYIYAITEIVDLLQTWENLETSTFTMSYLTSHILGISKLSIVLIFRKSIDKFCKNLNEGVFKPNPLRSGPQEQTIISNATKTCNLQGSFFHVFVILIVGQRALYAILDKGRYENYFDEKTNSTFPKLIRTLPYSCWLPFEPIDSPYYELGVSYQVISACFFGFIIGAIDALICGILSHIKAQFLILKNCLKTYFERGVYLMQKDGFEQIESNNHVLQKYVDICICDCIKHHHAIIELADGAEITFSLLMLIQFLGSLFLICFQLFQLSLYELGSFRFFSMICYLFLMLYQILIYCWHGNEVMLVSNEIIDAAFESDWINVSTSSQKSLLLMMMRAQRPIKMSAGKFTFLSLETFMAIVRGSGSYFMVLRNMNINLK